MDLVRIVKLLPLGAVILIGLGVLKTSVYYNYFGVDIMSYLSTSEALTLFLNDYKPVFTLGIIAFFHFDFSDRAIDFIEDKTDFDIQSLIKNHKWKYFLFSISVTITFSYLIYFQKIHLYDLLIYFFVFSASNIISFYFINKNLGESLYNENRIVDFLQIFAFTCAIPFLSLREIRQIEHDQGTKVVLYLKNDEIESRKYFRFLGKAGENYFFHNPAKKETSIYKSEDIEQIKIKL